MKPDISEFSYGYALTSELIRSFQLRSVGAPVFPSLIQEGKVGYDVQIPGIPIFLQFKLSDRMVKGTAKQSYILGIPHFRMHLRPLRHSDQHNLLIELENSGYPVFYAAPEFSTATELNRAYDQGLVAQETAFWSPCEIGNLPDQGDHYIAFRKGDPIGYLCSEPVEVKKVPIKILIYERVKPQTLSPRARIPSHEYFNDITKFLVELYKRERPFRSPFEEGSVLEQSDRDPQEKSALIAQFLYGCSILFAFRNVDNS